MGLRGYKPYEPTWAESQLHLQVFLDILPQSDVQREREASGHGLGVEGWAPGFSVWCLDRPSACRARGGHVVPAAMFASHPAGRSTLANAISHTRPSPPGLTPPLQHAEPSAKVNSICISDQLVAWVPRLTLES